MKVSFLGLGNMGAGIAANILEAGFDLTVWNRTHAKTQPLVSSGARATQALCDAVEEADVVMTCLMDDQSIRDHLDTSTGILTAMRPQALHICLTTISPGFADELAEIHKTHGTRFIAGPVVGRPDAAEAGELMTILGGDLDALDTIQPLIDSYTSAAIRVGAVPGVAATLKLCLNYTVISTIELLAEVYACADKSGLDLNILHGLYQTIYAHPVFKMYATKLMNRDFDDGGFRMEGGLKDVRLMLEAAGNLQAPFEIGKIIERKMVSAMEQGMQDRDWSAIYEISRQQAGLV